MREKNMTPLVPAKPQRINAMQDDNPKASIEHAALLLRKLVSEAELAGKIDERKALGFIEQLREIERVLTKHI